VARRPRMLAGVVLPGFATPVLVTPVLATTLLATTLLATGCAPAGQPSLARPAGQPSAAVARVPSTPGSGTVKLSETGSTLLYPLMQSWATAYHQRYGQVTISTAGTGSGAGIQGAADGTANIGASDAFLSSGDLVDNPSLLNIPLAISAQQVNYYLPQVPASQHVKLDGPVLAQMYDGAITNWDAPAIRNLNPGIHLPNLKIVPLHRMDSSGDTFLFTTYLATIVPAWGSAIGYGTTVAWPNVPGALAETGNSGMVLGCRQHPGCVAYIGIAYLDLATGAGLGEAELSNAAGRYFLPDAASISAAAASFVSLLPANETISMINGPATDGYPLVNYEYAIVSTRQPAAKARDVQAFLHWAITTGNAASFLGPVRFQPLPAEVVALDDAQIARIR
jgi:phosphate transport system substrate-binding protein